MPVTRTRNSFGARATFDRGDGSTAYYYRLNTLEEAGSAYEPLAVLDPHLVELVLREVKTATRSPKTISAILPNGTRKNIVRERTAVQASARDLARLYRRSVRRGSGRDASAMHRLGGDTKRIQPQIPVDLVIDHSVQVDQYGTANALQFNIDMEFERNRERYEFLRWGQNAFENFRVVPPSVGLFIR